MERTAKRWKNSHRYRARGRIFPCLVNDNRQNVFIGVRFRTAKESRSSIFTTSRSANVPPARWFFSFPLVTIRISVMTPPFIVTSNNLQRFQFAPPQSMGGSVELMTDLFQFIRSTGNPRRVRHRVPAIVAVVFIER